MVHIFIIWFDICQQRSYVQMLSTPGMVLMNCIMTWKEIAKYIQYTSMENFKHKFPLKIYSCNEIIKKRHTWKMFFNYNFQQENYYHIVLLYSII